MAYKNNSPISVVSGGSGASSLTSNGPLYGNGTSAIQAMAAGTNGQFVGANTSAAPTWQTPGGGSGITALAVQVFTSSGTYTPTSGMVYCIMECVGAGGGSSSTSGSTIVSAGGGGGGYARKLFAAATVGASQTVTVGTGSTGNGGTTSVGSLISAGGGNGGTAITNSTQPGGTGGISSTGTVLSRGEPGGIAMSYATSAASDLIMSGQGGNSIFGGGAPAQAGFSSIPTVLSGIAGYNYGGGASGAIGSGGSGAAGAGGIVIITEYT